MTAVKNSLDITKKNRSLCGGKIDFRLKFHRKINQNQKCKRISR